MAFCASCFFEEWCGRLVVSCSLKLTTGRRCAAVATAQPELPSQEFFPFFPSSALARSWVLQSERASMPLGQLEAGQLRSPFVRETVGAGVGGSESEHRVFFPGGV